MKLNLKRKTSDYETKSIDVTLTLNQDYLDWYIRRYAEMLGDKEEGTYDSASIKMILDSILNTLDVAKDFDLTGLVSQSVFTLFRCLIPLNLLELLHKTVFIHIYLNNVIVSLIEIK